MREKLDIDIFYTENLILEELNRGEVDVLVVGAGPAGCSAALASAQSGANVLVIDKKTLPGKPVQCAEYIPKLLAVECSLPQDVIARRVDILNYFLGEEQGSVRAPGYIINRDVFDSLLCARAVENGAKLLTNARAIHKQGDDVLIEYAGKVLRIRAKIIIGADGPCSKVASWMGNKSPELYVGAQHSIRLLSGDVPEIYFSPIYGSGYGWFFPKGDRANVGVSVPISEAKGLKVKLDAFCDQLASNGKIDKQWIYNKSGGLIPVGGPLQRTVYKNMIVVGDAGGQTNPLTGSGIAPAVISGRMAGKWAAEAALQDNPALLRHYDDEWKTLYYNSLSRALNFRREIETHRTSPREFYALVKRSWGFR